MSTACAVLFVPVSLTHAVFVSVDIRQNTITREAWILSVTIILTEEKQVPIVRKQCFSSQQNILFFQNQAFMDKERQSNGLPENQGMGAVVRQFLNMQISSIHRFTFVSKHLFLMYPGVFSKQKSFDWLWIGYTSILCPTFTFFHV